VEPTIIISIHLASPLAILFLQKSSFPPFPGTPLGLRPGRGGTSRARPSTGAHRHRDNPLAIFCDQVFFDNDPSSATSLLSSVGITTRAMWQSVTENVTGRWCDSDRVLWQCLCDVWLGDSGPFQELAEPPKILLRSSATRCSLITILLLLPVFFLRSASRPRPNPKTTSDAWVWCDIVWLELLGETGRRERGKTRGKEGGHVRKGKQPLILSGANSRLRWFSTRIFLDFYLTRVRPNSFWDLVILRYLILETRMECGSWEPLNLLAFVSRGQAEIWGTFSRWNLIRKPRDDALSRARLRVNEESIVKLLVALSAQPSLTRKFRSFWGKPMCKWHQAWWLNIFLTFSVLVKNSHLCPSSAEDEDFSNS